MWDLVLAAAVLVLASVASFWCGASCKTALLRSLLGVSAVAFIIACATMFQGRLYIARLLPFSNIIVLGNWLPPGAALLAGVIYAHESIPRERQSLLIVAILTVGWYSVIWHIYPQDFPSANRYRNGVCIQSWSTTCSACAAVTLLDYHGIQSNEQEMARLCLTSGRGTNVLGIFRGLKIKTADTDFAVQIVQCDYEAARKQDLPPMLIPVAAPGVLDIGGGSTMRQDHSSFKVLGHSLLRMTTNWFTRTDHSVVFYGFSRDGFAIIGDPSLLESQPCRWSEEKMRRSWLGYGFCLVPRVSRN